MKKSTIALIIICIVSLILGIIFTVASVMSLRTFGMKQIGEFWDENKNNWSWYEIQVETDDGADVYARIPLPDSCFNEETGEFEGPFFSIHSRTEDARIRIEKCETDDEESRADEENLLTTQTES